MEWQLVLGALSGVLTLFFGGMGTQRALSGQSFFPPLIAAPIASPVASPNLPVFSEAIEAWISNNFTTYVPPSPAPIASPSLPASPDAIEAGISSNFTAHVPPSPVLPPRDAASAPVGLLYGTTLEPQAHATTSTTAETLTAEDKGSWLPDSSWLLDVSNLGILLAFLSALAWLLTRGFDGTADKHDAPPTTATAPPGPVVYRLPTEYGMLNSILDGTDIQVAAFEALIANLEIAEAATTAQQAEAALADSDLLRMSLDMELLDTIEKGKAEIEELQQKVRRFCSHAEQDRRQRKTDEGRIWLLERKLREIHLAPLSFSGVQSVSTALVAPSRAPTRDSEIKAEGKPAEKLSFSNIQSVGTKPAEPARATYDTRGTQTILMGPHPSAHAKLARTNYASALVSQHTRSNTPAQTLGFSGNQSIETPPAAPARAPNHDMEPQTQVVSQPAKQLSFSGIPTVETDPTEPLRATDRSNEEQLAASPRAAIMIARCPKLTTIRMVASPRTIMGLAHRLARHRPRLYRTGDRTAVSAPTGTTMTARLKSIMIRLAASLPTIIRMVSNLASHRHHLYQMKKRMAASFRATMRTSRRLAGLLLSHPRKPMKKITTTGPLRATPMGHSPVPRPTPRSQLDTTIRGRRTES